MIATTPAGGGWGPASPRSRRAASWVRRAIHGSSRPSERRQGPGPGATPDRAGPSTVALSARRTSSIYPLTHRLHKTLPQVVSPLLTGSATAAELRELAVAYDDAMATAGDWRRAIR